MSDDHILKAHGGIISMTEADWTAAMMGDDAFKKAVEEHVRQIGRKMPGGLIMASTPPTKESYFAKLLAAYNPAIEEDDDGKVPHAYLTTNNELIVNPAMAEALRTNSFLRGDDDS